MTEKRGAILSTSYKDPGYANIEAGLEERYGIPKGILSALRTKGERSNADQVSEAGARSVYQIIPGTRDNFLKAYGVDAYASPAAAAEVAALHIRDSHRRTRDWNAAIAEYHGGTDRRNWGKRTKAYVGRVAGTTMPDRVTAENVPALPDPNTIDLMATSAGDFAWAKRPLGPQPPVAPDESKKARRLDRVLASIPTHTAIPNTPVIAAEVAAERGAVAQESRRQGLADRGWWSRLSAAVDEEWLLPQLARSLDQAMPEGSPENVRAYMDRREEIEQFAVTPAERLQLREAAPGGADALAAAKQHIERTRANRDVMDATGHATAFSLLAGLSDPVGWVAGAGMGKAFQVAGIGSRALLAAGRTGAATASLAAESAIGNVAFTGLLDAAGRTTTSEDYAMSAGAGALIGFGLAPIVLRGKPAVVPDAVHAVIADAQRAQGERLAQATANLGEGATPDRVAAEAQRLDAVARRDFLTVSLADVPDSERLLHSDPDKLLTADAGLRSGVDARYSLGDTVADETERSLLAEHLARSEAIVAANPIDANGLKTILSAGGMESTGLRLLASNSPVAKAVGLTLLESTTGAGGRRSTAAMTMHVRQRMYNRVFFAFDDLYHNFRRGEGEGLASDFVTGKARRRFNERVFDEVEARADTPDGQTFDANPFVREAADLWERGMGQMRQEMQHVGVVGAARLGTTSRGYMMHKLDARKVIGLSPVQRTRVIAELQAQFVDPQNGFGAAFSQRLAVKYLERSMDAAKGGYDVPMNMRSPEAASTVRDALEAMSLPPAEVDRLMGRFSNGGAGFTKRRLRLNLNADLGDGMKLRDLFNTDLGSLYRGYARRVAGEVSLAQYGVMGRKGLDELRKAIAVSGGSASDMHAFDQIAAEFLNTPYGNNNHRYMDNIRTATSVARLGGMGFTQFAEYGNAIATLGVQRTFGAIGALPRMVAEVSAITKGGEAANPILRSIDQLGGELGLDDYQLTRMFDVRDNDIQVYSSANIGLGTRSLRAASHMQAVLTGQRLITAVQTRAMAEQIVRKAMQYISDGRESIALADMGISPELAGRIRADLGNIATFEGGKLRSLDLMRSTLSGPDIKALRDSIERGASQIIQRTYIGETGQWAHNGLLKVLAQFRTFGITAVEKQWGRGVRNYGAVKQSMYLLGAMSFAVPIHIARVQTKMLSMGDAKREAFADKNLSVGALGRATMNYASASGLLGDIWDIGGGFASTIGGDGGEELAAQIGVRGTKGQDKLLGGVVAPGVGLVEDVWDGVHGDGKKLVKMMPGANLPYTQPIINSFINEGK